MKIVRSYSCKDVDMLMAAKTITTTFQENLDELSGIRTNWDETYINGLNEKIDYAIESYLGLDKKKELRDASAKLYSIQSPAIRDLSFLRTQIKVDFKEEAESIYKELGFNSELIDVLGGNQETLIQQLYAFKKGLTEGLFNRITEKGTDAALLNRIISYADQLTKANITQETFKETTKETTLNARKAFNEIYHEVIGICKIVSSYYQFDSLKREQFTFSKVVSNMNAARKMLEMIAA